MSADPLDVVSGRSVARVRRIILAGLERLPETLSTTRTAAAIEARAPARARGALGSVRPSTFDGLADALRAELVRSGRAEGRDGRVVRKAEDTIGLRFDLTDPAAIAWAERRAGKLIVEIDKATRDAIRALVARALREGGNPRIVARSIKPLIGLHQRWAVAVLNYRLRLEKRGLSGSRVEQATARYYQKLLRARSLNIARTEILRASNEGRRQAWVQAQRLGLLPGAEKVWLAAGDACEVCAATDGQTVALDDEFSNAYGSFEMPPAHPSCRCTAVIRASSVQTAVA